MMLDQATPGKWNSVGTNSDRHVVCEAKDLTSDTIKIFEIEILWKSLLRDNITVYSALLESKCGHERSCH